MQENLSFHMVHENQKCSHYTNTNAVNPYLKNIKYSSVYGFIYKLLVIKLQDYMGVSTLKIQNFPAIWFNE